MTVFLVTLWCSIKKIEAPYLFDWEYGIALHAMQGNRASFPSTGMSHGISRVDLGYTDLFCIPEVHQGTSRFVTEFLGTLWCSIKKIEAPYVFNWEYDIALHEMQGNQASSPGEGYVSWDFSSCGRNLGYILELQRGWPFETPLCSAKSGLLSSYDGTSGI